MSALSDRVRDSDDDGLWGSLLRYPRVYRNWPSVIFHRVRGEFPLDAVLYDGRTVRLTSPLQLYRSARYEAWGWRYEACSDTVTIPVPYGPGHASFEGAGGGGDLVGVFGHDAYGGLSVQGKTVIDVGANIGDSVVYFALRGARHVVGLEPFPLPYGTSVKNVERNGLVGRVTMLRAAVGAVDRSIAIDGEQTAALGASVAEGRGTLATPVVSLRTLVDRFDVTSGVLKMDCEGDEYAVLEAAGPEVLSRFTDVLVEYHHGVQDLVPRLQAAGFEVAWRQRMPPSLTERLWRKGFTFQLDHPIAARVRGHPHSEGFGFVEAHRVRDPVGQGRLGSGARRG